MSAGCLQLAASVEQLSEHPFAQAIVAEAERRDIPLREVAAFHAHIGKGVVGVVDGLPVAAGNLALMGDIGADPEPVRDPAGELAAEAQTVIYLAVDRRVAGLIAVADPIRPTSREAVERLKALGTRGGDAHRR